MTMFKSRAPAAPSPSAKAAHQSRLAEPVEADGVTGARIKRTLAFLALVLASLAAVQPVSAHASVFVDNLRWPIRSDGYAVIPVCVVDGSSAQQTSGGVIHDPNPGLNIVVGKVRDALRTSWERHSSVRFVGWQPCKDLTATERRDAVGLYIHPDAGNRSYLGTTARGGTDDGAGASTSLKPWGYNCIRYNVGRARNIYSFDCAEQYGIHEFGHAIGFHHEWRHPETPAECAATRGEHEQPLSASDVAPIFGAGSYTVVNPSEYDWDSNMTYDDECADVTGVRFGSTSLSVWDQRGAAAVYPPVQQRQTDVGVIADKSGSCPDPTEVTIYQDNEDTDNNNQSGGWIGAIVTNRNTTYQFCKVDGTRFARLAAAGGQQNDYAVLKLGSACPAGSTEFVRYQDDADEPPVNESWMAGETGPTRQNFDGGTGSELHWCLFQQTSDNTGTAGLPDFGFDYGVLAPASFGEAAATGWLYTDDEDDENQNRLMNANLGGLDAGTKSVVDRLMATGSNTKFLFAKVNVNKPPTVSAALLPTEPNEGQSVSFEATGSDPDGDALSYSWDFGNGDTAAGRTTSHTFRESGSYTVKVTATDPDGLSASATLIVPIANVAPSVSVTDAAIDEGEEAKLDVTINDPGGEDAFEVTVRWGDGTHERFTRPAAATGTQSLSLSHLYGDDDPSGTPIDDYPVAVTVSDDDGGWTQTDAAVSVANLAPTTVIDAVRQGGNLIGDSPPATVDSALAGLAVELEGSLTDVGSRDTHELAIAWGDGTVDGDALTGSHVYATPGRYTVTLTVTDDDTGTASASQTIHVVDAARTVADTAAGLSELLGDHTLDPQAADLVRRALTELVGNNNGAAANGALDHLEAGAWNAALVKLAKATATLERADRIVDLSVSQLVLSAKAVVVEQLRRAAERATPERLATVEALIRAGDTRWAHGDGSGAVEMYRKALDALPR